MEKILVSACLLGENCKYNGKNNYIEKIEIIKKHFNIIPICPESLGGLSIPRDPSEINKNGLVYSKKGKDVTKNFVLGKNRVINIAKYFKIKKAILKERSPSCGVNSVYDGTFSGVTIKGSGITATSLKELGLTLYTEETLDSLINEITTNN